MTRSNGFFFFSSRRRHTRCGRDWSSDVCSSDLEKGANLFVEKKCIECHGAEGRGDGNPFNLKDDWGFPIQPANMHKCWNFRSEEHTSELQSRPHLVCRLLLEKKKNR